MLAVRVCDARSLVRGRARNYLYFVARLFFTSEHLDNTSWLDTRLHTKPRRSLQLAEQEGRELAFRRGAFFLSGFGTLHKTPFSEDIMSTVESVLTLHHTSDGHYKFWSRMLVGNVCYVHFGKIGTTGQVQIKRFDSPYYAAVYSTKMVHEKRNKGYSIVDSVPFSHLLPDLELPARAAPVSAVSHSSSPATRAVRGLDL